ncbi:Crp/Fnr family transcriptional regulator [Curtanaerobium respiraculi]|uniref:Crp/Fnr family transcriptional regulator n=1 Tax=Curtanaerobium respiraculi TaxID=2949669 RepID=UPI0024B32EB2|nr:Crp/Fnr family transcriptional regulator [Curtanaerobium respiraculi]
MDQNVADAIIKSTLFAGLARCDLDLAVKKLDVYPSSYEDGELLLSLGSICRNAGIVVSGRVRIDFYDEAGNPSTIAKLGPGGSFGEAIACSGDPSLVQVQAVGPTQVLWIDIPRIMSAEYMAGSPYAGMVMVNAMRLLARKNMMLNRKMQMLAQKRLRDRIKLYLLQRERQDAANDQVDFEMTRAALAKYLSADRSSLSRELGKLRDEGVLALEGNTIRVLDRSFLET